MPSDRTDFLRDYYHLLTDDIRRSEAIIPKVCGLELGALVFLITVRWLRGPLYMPTLLVMFTSAWAIHMLINANLWARRSQLMAANVEREFFTSGDMNVLLPSSYYRETRAYRYRRIFRGSLLLSLACFVLGLSSLPLNLDLKSMACMGLGILLLSLLFVENRNSAREYEHLIAHAPGRGTSAAE
jgi:hypothetical protein